MTTTNETKDAGGPDHGGSMTTQDEALAAAERAFLDAEWAIIIEAWPAYKAAGEPEEGPGCESWQAAVHAVGDARSAYIAARRAKEQA